MAVEMACLLGDDGVMAHEPCSCAQGTQSIKTSEDPIAEEGRNLAELDKEEERRKARRISQHDLIRVGRAILSCSPCIAGGSCRLVFQEPFLACACRPELLGDVSKYATRRGKVEGA